MTDFVIHFPAPRENSRKRMPAGFTVVLAAVLALSLIPMAHAGNNGFYLGFSMGLSEIDNPGELDELCTEAGVVCGDNETATAFQGIFGYQFNHYLAMEAAVFDLGDPAVSTQAPIAATARLSLKGGSLSLIPQIPLGDLAKLYGKLGFVAGDAELSAAAPSLGLSDSDSTAVGGLVFGFGGAVNVGKNLVLRLGWERYSFDEALMVAGSDVDAPNIDLFTGHAIFHFGSD